MGARRQVVRGGAVPKMRVHDDPEPLQFLEIPVDGRQVDVRGSGLDQHSQVLGAVVSRVVEDGLEQQAARAGHPTPALADEGQDVVDRADVVLRCAGSEGNTHGHHTVRGSYCKQVAFALPWR